MPISDAAFAWFTLVLWISLIAAYAIRVVRFGSFRSERVAGVGGTILMGQGIMKATYWAIEPAVRAIVALGLTPNAVTTFALILGLGAGVAVALGLFGLACLLATISTICDILDGQVARFTNTGSARGELYDATVDRYTEFAFITGFVVYAHASLLFVLIGLAALQASFMISYASAKAEALGVSVPRGLMRRHERAACLTLGAGLTPMVGTLVHARWAVLPPHSMFALGLAAVATIGGAAAVLRLTRIHRALS
jgi:CDP-diacylglycerol--glycerol-3-phosphate 3-phosphatidyltransferase